MDEILQSVVVPPERPPTELEIPLYMDLLLHADLFGMERPYPWQLRAVADVIQGKPTALLAANGSGKTSAVALLSGLYFMSKWPGAKVVSTSGSWMQIATQLCPKLERGVSHLRDWNYTDKRLVGPDIYVEGQKLNSTWTWFSTDEPMRAEGHHKELIHRNGKTIEIPLLYMIDEGKNVEQGVFDSMDRCRTTSRLIMSSPGEDFGPFFEAIEGKNRGLWTTTKVTWLDCPHLVDDPREKLKIENDIRIKGRKHPIVGSQYFAEWIRRDGYYVFKSEDIRTAMSGTVKRFSKDRRCAIDYSQGGDEQVIGVREGNAVIDWQSYHEGSAIRLSKTCIEVFNRHGLQPHQITVDAGGVGKEFCDILDARGWAVNRYMNGDKARAHTIYANRYTEDCFEAVGNRLTELILPDDPVLERQMRARKYIMPNDESNRRRLEPKEALRSRGLESPDRLDCLIMLFADLPDIANFQGPRQMWDQRRICTPDGATTKWSSMHGMRMDS